MIVSMPEYGMDEKFGLTELGIEQSKQSAEASQLPADTIIYSSDFSRAIQTAKIVAETIGANPPIASPELRERGYGEFELASDNHYHEVSQADIAGEIFGRGVENLVDVSDRAVRLIEGIETVHRGKTILLVSHGDTLQVIQTAFKNLHPSLDYNKVGFMDNAEIKQIKR